MTWSTNMNLFYIAAEHGIYQLTTAGESTFVARLAFPTLGSVGSSKAIAFLTVTNVAKLLVGHKDEGYWMEIDPETGDVLGELALEYPPSGGDPGDKFGGLLGLAQHPVTGVIYGIRKTDNNFARELVTINPQTGATTLVGNLGMHFTSMDFVLVPSLQVASIARNGNDLTLS